MTFTPPSPRKNPVLLCIGETLTPALEGILRLRTNIIYQANAHQVLGEASENTPDAIILNLDTTPGYEDFLIQRAASHRLLKVPCLVLSEQCQPWNLAPHLMNEFYFGPFQSALFQKRLDTFFKFHVHTHRHDDHVLDAEQLAQMAYYDVLTDLPNRQFFETKLKKVIQNSRVSLEPFSLLFFDLDGFKHMNDRLGHEAGDWLLRQVAQRVRRNIRRQDMVARLGGDEFALILLNVYEPKMVESIGQRILYLLSEPYHYDGSDINITVSIGCARFPEDSMNSEHLKKIADRRMYKAKEKGKSCLVFS